MEDYRSHISDTETSVLQILMQGRYEDNGGLISISPFDPEAWIQVRIEMMEAYGHLLPETPKEKLALFKQVLEKVADEYSSKHIRLSFTGGYNLFLPILKQHIGVNE